MPNTKQLDLSLDDTTKNSLVSNLNKPSKEVQEQASKRGLSFFDISSHNTKAPKSSDLQSQPKAKEDLQVSESGKQDLASEFSQNLSAPSFTPTGIAYFDNKLKEGLGFSFIEAYLAKNMLGIDLRAHINANVNMKQDQKTRNMTSLYQELFKTTKAIDSIDRALSSDLYHASGFGGAIKKGLRNTTGKQFSQDTERAWNNINQAVVDVANATKISGVTGKDHLNRIEDRFYASLTDSTTRGRALFDTREQLEANMINLYRTIAQMGGDPQMVEQMDSWYKQSQSNKNKLKQNYSKKESKVYDSTLYDEIINQKNPFSAFALNYTSKQDENTNENEQ